MGSITKRLRRRSVQQPFLPLGDWRNIYDPSSVYNKVRSRISSELGPFLGQPNNQGMQIAIKQAVEKALLDMFNAGDIYCFGFSAREYPKIFLKIQEKSHSQTLEMYLTIS